MVNIMLYKILCEKMNGDHVRGSNLRPTVCVTAVD